MPAEKMVEFVVKTDCLCDGEPLYRGDKVTLPESLFNELRAAGRVCNAEEAEVALASRAAPPPTGDLDGGVKTPKGKAA